VTTAVAGAGPEEPPAPALWAFTGYFLRLGATGFGGPIALAGAMRQELVERRRWITRQDYLDGLALAQLAPGPLAAQLAMYLGYVRGGLAGASTVAVAFVLPSLLIVWALSAAYVRYGGLPWMQGLFYGVGAAVIGIIVRSATSLARSTLTRDPLLWAIFAVLAAATAWTGREDVWLVLGAGLVALAARHARRPSAAALAAVAGAAPATAAATAAAASAAAPTTALQLMWFFAKAGAFVFGSGLAIVPFLHGGVVLEHHWLDERQFLDAVAVAMITPGPVVITVAFIGYVVARMPGLLAASAGVFLPVYLFVVLPAPYFRQHARQPSLAAFVEGVTAAATGAIAGAAIVLARRALVDGWTLAIAAATLLVLWRSKVAPLWPIGVSGALGLWLHR
jgi:chromate transporter